MKKLIIFLFLTLFSLGIQALDLPLAVGVEAGYSFKDLVLQPSPILDGSDWSLSQSYITLGVFVDLRYLDFRLNYKHSVGDLSFSQNLSTQILTTPYSFNYNYLALAASLKYPFDFDFGSIFAKIGLKADFYLSGETQTALYNFSSSDFTNIYVTAGAELQYKLSSNLFLNIPITVDYCIIPMSGYTLVPPQKEALFLITATFGIGYRF